MSGLLHVMASVSPATEERQSKSLWMRSAFSARPPNSAGWRQEGFGQSVYSALAFATTYLQQASLPSAVHSHWSTGDPAAGISTRNGGFDALGGEREFPDAYARRTGDGVGDGGRRRSLG